MDVMCTGYIRRCPGKFSITKETWKRNSFYILCWPEVDFGEKIYLFSGNNGCCSFF